MNFTLKKVLTYTKYSVIISKINIGDLLMKKNRALYVVMLMVWTILSFFLWFTFIPSIINVPYFDGGDKSIVIKILSICLLAFNGIFISYFLVERSKGLY